MGSRHSSHYYSRRRIEAENNGAEEQESDRVDRPCYVACKNLGEQQAATSCKALW